MKRSIVSTVVVLALAIAAAGPAARVRAQTPPTRFYGAVMMSGQPAPAGTELKAYVNGIECGAATISEDGRYVLDVASEGTVEGCGFDEAEVEFAVNGMTAAERGMFDTGHFVSLDLTVDIGAPPVPEPGVETPSEPAPEPSMEEPQPQPAPEEPGDMPSDPGEMPAE